MRLNGCVKTWRSVSMCGTAAWTASSAKRAVSRLAPTVPPSLHAVLHQPDLVQDVAPDTLDDLYDELEEATDVGSLVARLSAVEAAWLARYVLDKCRKERESFGEAIEQSLRVCHPVVGWWEAKADKECRTHAPRAK
jgi:hypothetical protein